MYVFKLFCCCYCFIFIIHVYDLILALLALGKGNMLIFSVEVKGCLQPEYQFHSWLHKALFLSLHLLFKSHSIKSFLDILVSFAEVHYLVVWEVRHAAHWPQRPGSKGLLSHQFKNLLSPQASTVQSFCLHPLRIFLSHRMMMVQQQMP